MTGLRVFLTADGGSVAATRDGTLVADGRVRRTDDGWAASISIPATAPGPVDAEAVAGVLAHLASTVEPAGHGPLRWLVSAPTAQHDDAADRAGLVHRRDLLQLRRPLPVGDVDRSALPAITTRPFRVGVDEAAWVAVNNRAFADHPDQSGQTVDDLERQERETWFSADGFLLLDAADRPGRLDGFCWTKVHAAHEPPLGEIYVIGVDPVAHGHHLGPALTVAGLDHLAALGLTVGMLYVDVANEGAVRMYERLGFTTHHLDRIYS